METPLISIIVPVYNVHPYLEACLASLQKQNYPKLEFILIDDGSTDGSGVFCDEFAKTDPRARVIHQDNKGLSGARNRGLREARGDYITFVDSDDTIAADYVQYLFNIATKHQLKMSICAIKELTTKGREINYGVGYEEKTMSTEEALGRMLREEGFTVVAYAKLYHKSLWEGITFPENTVHEDLGTTYKLIERCHRIAYGPEPKYLYRKREGSISSQGFSDSKLDIIRLTDLMCESIGSRFPYLVPTNRLRRMHARFSVLRQLILAKNLTKEQRAAEQEIITFLKSRKKYILKNPQATFRDKLAIRSLLISKTCFKLAWLFYTKIRP